MNRPHQPNPTRSRLIEPAYQKQTWPAPSEIKNWPTEEQGEKMLQRLRAPSPAIRLQAAKWLKQDQQALPAVINTLVELSFANHQKIAQGALAELAQIDDPQALCFLKDILHWGSTKEIREKASGLVGLLPTIQEYENNPNDIRPPPAAQVGARGEEGVAPSPPRPLAPSQNYLSQLPMVGTIYNMVLRFKIQSFVISMTMLAELQILLANPTSGLLLNIATLFILLYIMPRRQEAQASRLNTALLLIPLMRILSLGLPLTALPQNYWLLVIAIPLFVAIFLVTRKSPQPWTRQELGLTLNSLPLQLLIPTTALGLGWLHYQLLTPDPLATELTWQALWLPALILLVSTGCLEELLFRGLLQSAAISAMGRRPAIIFVAALSTSLHIGYAQFPILAFIFAIGLAFGWFVARTHSIIGVTLTHGLMNISLFLIWPLW